MKFKAVLDGIIILSKNSKTDLLIRRNNGMSKILDSQRGYRAVKLGGKAAEIAIKKGIREAGSEAAIMAVGKANVVMAVVDAAINVAIAVQAYLQYRQIKEQTKQLLAGIQLEEKRLNQFKQTLNIAVKENKDRLEDRQLELDAIINARKQTFKILEMIREVLDKLRSSPEEEYAPDVKMTFQQLYQKYEYALGQYIALDEVLHGTT